MSEHQIRIAGLFEPVAIALSTLRSVSVVETTESHVLMALPSGAAALARPTADGSAVEVTLVGTAGLEIATRLAEELRTLLVYEITGPGHALHADGAPAHQ